MSQGSYPIGKREFQEDFEAGVLTANLSTVRRPDALSFSYLQAFTVGPIAIGDQSGGTLNRPWYCRVDNTTKSVYIAKANDANDAWEAESVLFTFTGEDPIDEVDVAFEQNARPVVVAERSGHLWIYWFDSTISQFSFDDFGPGRCARVALDDHRFNSMTSDVMVFYINEEMGDSGTVCYRVQRERYQTENTTPLEGGAFYGGINLPAIENLYLEDLFQSRKYRLTLVFSVREPLTGVWSIGRLASTMYPIEGEIEPSDVGQIETLDGLLELVLFIVAPPGTEESQLNDAFTTVEDLVGVSHVEVLGGSLFINLIAILVTGATPPEGLAPDQIYEDAIAIEGNDIAQVSVVTGSLMSNLLVAMISGITPPSGVDPSRIYAGLEVESSDVGQVNVKTSELKTTVIIADEAAVQNEPADVGQVTLSSGTLV